VSRRLLGKRQSYKERIRASKRRSNAKRKAEDPEALAAQKRKQSIQRNANNNQKRFT